MSILIFLAAIAAGYSAFKRRSPLAFAGAGALVAASFLWYSDAGIMDNLMYVLSGRLVPLGLCAAVGYGASMFYFKSKGQLKPGAAKSDWASDSGLAGMKLLVGRIIDTRSSSTVLSDVHLGRDVFGNAETYTTHSVQMNHNTWLYDLNNETEVNYSGSGTIEARAGHILGTMSWGGRSCLDINFSTQKSFSVPDGKTHLINSIVTSLGLVVFGWMMFPILMLIAPMVWKGWTKWNGKLGAFSNVRAPGADRIEAVMIYGGALAYLVAALAVLASLTHPSVEGFFVPVICFFVFSVWLHQRTLKRCAAAHEKLMAAGREGLNRLYAEAMAKQATVAAQQQAVSLGAAAPVAS